MAKFGWIFGVTLATGLACSAGGTTVRYLGNSGDNVPDDGTDAGKTSTGCAAGEVKSGNTCKPLPTQCPCPSGSYCDLAANTCVAGCLDDSGCSAGQFCNPQRQCQTGCLSDKGCASTQYCDSVSQTCLTGCRSASDCPDTGKCVNHSCSCGGSQISCGGSCVSCPSSAKMPGCCGSSCIELDNDVNNCGTCGNDCQTWAASNGLTNPLCYGGKCAGTLAANTLGACSTACTAAGLACHDPAPTTTWNSSCQGACIGSVSYQYTDPEYGNTDSCSQAQTLTTCKSTPPTSETCSDPYYGSVSGYPVAVTCLCGQ